MQGADMFGGYIRNVSAPISAADNPVAYDHANGIALPGAPWEWGPESKQYAGRATLVWTPADNLKGTLKVLASHYQDNGEVATQQLVSCPAGFPHGALEDLGALGYGMPVGVVVDPSGQCNPRNRTTSIGALPAELAAAFPGSNGGVPYSKTDSLLSSLNLTYGVGPISLTSITGFYNIKNENFSNYDYSTFSLVNASISSTNSTWSEEFRAISHFDGPLNFYVGAYYEDFHRDYQTYAGLARAVDPVTGNLNNNFTDDFQSGKTYSGVGALTWTPLQNVELEAGARYTHETKEGYLNNVYVQAGLVSALGIYAPPGAINADFSADNVSPQVTLSWHPVKDINLFVGYHTGFKSGGISEPNFVASSATAANVVFRNEKANGVEGGIKFESEDRQWSGDVTLYHYIYKDLQVSAFNPLTNVVSIVNAGRAQVDGIEPTLKYAINRNLSLHTSLSYNRARYTEFNTAQCLRRPDGGRRVQP